MASKKPAPSPPTFKEEWPTLVALLGVGILVAAICRPWEFHPQTLPQAVRTDTISLSPGPTPLPTTTSVVQGNQPPVTGQEGTIHVQSSQVFVTPTQEDYSAFSKALAANDQVGISNLAARGRLFLIDNGTRVLVLGHGGFLSALTQVRLLDGQQAGLAVWLPSEFLTR